MVRDHQSLNESLLGKKVLSDHHSETKSHDDAKIVPRTTNKTRFEGLNADFVSQKDSSSNATIRRIGGSSFKGYQFNRRSDTGSRNEGEDIEAKHKASEESSKAHIQLKSRDSRELAKPPVNKQEMRGDQFDMSDAKRVQAKEDSQLIQVKSVVAQRNFADITEGYDDLPVMTSQQPTNEWDHSLV